MTVHYGIRSGLAWIEALDGGRSERIAWIADVATGEMFELNGTGWLVWILLSEGASTPEDLQSTANDSGVGDAFGIFDVPMFLDELVEAGVLMRVDSDVAFE